MAGIIKEFREFAVQGNVVDMAVGIIIGAAFGTVVSSLVENVIMPPIGLLLGGMDFSNLALVLSSAQLDEAGEVLKEAVAINYGSFINDVVSFVIVGFAVFMLVKAINKVKRAQPEEEAAPEEPTTKDCPECAMEIPIAAKRCGYCGTEQA